METHYEKVTKKVLVKYITSNFSLVTIVLETSENFCYTLAMWKSLGSVFQNLLSSFLQSAFLIKVQSVSAFLILIAIMTIAAWLYPTPLGGNTHECFYLVFLFFNFIKFKYFLSTYLAS